MLFIDEHEMQQAAQTIAREIYKDTSPYRDADIERFIVDAHQYPSRWCNNQTIINTLQQFDPSTHYIIMSYARLFLQGNQRPTK